VLLDKGLKCSLSYKRNQWICNLAFEAETATTLPPLAEQEYIRHQIAHNIKKLYKEQNERPDYSNIQTRNENKIINQIKDKLTKNKAMISKAGKGNSIIILYQEEHAEKINKFISNNSLTIANGITKKLQKAIRNTINECQHVIHKSNIWKYVNLNPMTPTIRGLVKLYKEDAPIRPITNWRNAPSYKLAKMLTKKLHTYIPIPYNFNIKNTVQLMTDLTDLPYDHSIIFASFDITIMYPNIPKNEAITIIKKLCETNGREDSIKQDIIKNLVIPNRTKLFPFSRHNLHRK